MLLARLGHSVLLLDRAAFPSDTLSTHFLRPPEIERLRRWGLLSPVLASGCPPIRNVTTWSAGILLSGTPPMPPHPDAAAYAPRRTVLDHVLVDGAVAAGAELRERFPVVDVVWDDGHVVGIEGRTPQGVTVRERARVVVGADGMRSFIASRTGAPTYDAVPTLTTTYYTYWEAVNVDSFEAYYSVSPPRSVLMFPTNDGLVCTFVQWPRSEFASVRREVQESMRRAFDLMPGVGARFANARVTERFRGTADHPSFFRKPYGSGWALVGDAGYHRDALTAQGIKDAFESAELLASALHRSLGLGEPEEETLAEYERLRNEAVRERYEMTCRAITFPAPSPELIRLRSALLGDQQATDEFMGVGFGTVERKQFYGSEKIKAILSV